MCSTELITKVLSTDILNEEFMKWSENDPKIIQDVLSSMYLDIIDGTKCEWNLSDQVLSGLIVVSSILTQADRNDENIATLLFLINMLRKEDQYHQMKKSLLAALIGRNNRSGLETELIEETRDKLDQWYMQQVFNKYRQMATLAAAQAHHQSATAAAAVLAATSQRQKHQAAAAALAAAVNAAASAGAGLISGGPVDSSVCTAAANCQSLLNLDLDASSLASSASGHSNNLKDNHQNDQHHTRGPNLSSYSSSHLPLLSTGRSSDSSPGERSGISVGGGDKVKTEGVNLSSNNSSCGSSNSKNNLNNNSKDNGNLNVDNRTSPNAPGQYVRTRIRTSFDPEMELPKLHKWFSENQHPTRPQIQQFVKELNSLESRRGRKPLDVNNVVYWFKNARAAHKRHELKLVNGSQSPTLSNNNGNNNTVANNNSNVLNSILPNHLRVPFDGRIGLGSRSRLGTGLIGDGLGVIEGLGSGRSGNGTGGENEFYPDSNGNEDLLDQMYNDDGSDADDYENDDMIMDDDCSSQISQTLDLSVRPVKRQRSDSSPPTSPISGPSSLSDLIRGTPSDILVSAPSCHSNFNVKDEPPSDDDDDDYDEMDERDAYTIQTGRHGSHLPQGNNLSGQSSNDPHNLSSSANYLGSDSINGGIGDLSSGRHHSSSSSNLNNGGSSQGQPDSPEEGRRARRSRTFIDPTSEVPKLEQWFHLCTHPTHPQIVQYTDELNSSPYRLKYPKLEPKNIQFWFKNRRAKSKRQNLPISSSNTSSSTATASAPIAASNCSGGGGGSGPTSSSSTTVPLTVVTTTITSTSTTTTTTSSPSPSSLSPSLTSNCSVSSSLSLATGPASTSVSSALTIDRLIGH